VARRKLRVRLPTNYAEQTYASPYWIVRYPHQKRISTATDALLSAQPAALLDYGAGDGKLLFEAFARGLVSTTVVAYEPVVKFSDRLLRGAEACGVSDRVTLVRDHAELANYRFDYITCLSVLEHMPLLQRYAFYDVCQTTLNPNGCVLIDVPVEIGPTLVLKAVARRVLKGRDREYTPRELLRIMLGAIIFDPQRFDPANTDTWIHHHKGFDYRLLQREMAHRFVMTDDVRPTPLGFLPAPLGNQEVFMTALKSSTSQT
jgi:2-polyprenyl-3-methyl-5-hydroxy-6-metoxy-1,4-benzoquinol methylase